MEKMIFAWFYQTTIHIIIIHQQKNMEKEIIINNKLNEISRISQFMEELGVSLNIPSEIAMSINLAIEEIIANIIQNAYPDDKLGKILLQANITPGKLTFQITDEGVAVDPFQNGNPGRNAKQQTKRDGRRKSDIGYTGYPCYNIVNHKAAGYPDQYSCHQSNDFRLKDRDYSDNKPDQIT